MRASRVLYLQMRNANRMTAVALFGWSGAAERSGAGDYNSCNL